MMELNKSGFLLLEFFYNRLLHKGVKALIYPKFK